ncbi:MAG TPA: hypothetical protein VN672_02890 [Solirubrobacteraceae bacterium]|nr:hypothetical protein [Solirubrobacteraceae bacterium]
MRLPKLRRSGPAMADRAARVKGRAALALALGALLLGAAAVACASLRSGSSTRGNGAGWNGFGAGNWPGAGWRPYADGSPFNQPIGKATVHPNSAALVAGVLQWGGPSDITAGTAGSSEDWGHPVYFAQPSDHVYVLRATESWGRNALTGMRIRIPAQARPAGGGDGHMTVVTPDGWEYDFWRAKAPPAGGGEFDFAWGGRVRILGSGLGSGATAARFASLAGVIRPEELAAGRIDHALFIVLKCTGSGAGFGYGAHQSSSRWTGGFVYPAQAGAGTCGQQDPKLPPLGARFQLAMSRAQIAALHVPAWKRAILTALARYGGYAGDSGGPGFAVSVQSGVTYTSFGVPDRLVQVAQGAGIRASGGLYALDLAGGVDWRRYLRVVTPPARHSATRRHTHRTRAQTRTRTSVRSGDA